MNEDNNEGSNIQLDDCGCCQGTRKITPVKIENPPGLSAIRYRVGTHSQFKTSMIAGLQQTTLRNLTTREDDDFAIAILDGWATIGDILTFYQERIANEGFLRTAREHRSVLEMARSVGYELRPGVAASTVLAFTVDGAGAESTVIGVGTKVQSLPGEGETPQIFETVQDIEAHAEWNNLKPRSSQAQTITDSTTKFYFKGTDTLLKPGDLLLAVKGHGHDALPRYLRIVTLVKEDIELHMTVVDTVMVTDKPNKIIRLEPSLTDFAVQPIDLSILPTTIDIATLETSELKDLTSKRWTKSDLGTFEARYNLQLKDFFRMVNNLAPQLATSDGSDIQVYTFRIRAGIFGNNAPKFDALPFGQARDSYALDTGGKNVDIDEIGKIVIGGDDVSKVSITEVGPSEDIIFLDNNYPSILPSTDDKDSWILLRGQIGIDPSIIYAYRITNTREETMAKFLVTGKSTSLKIEARNEDLSAFKKDLSMFKIRDTTAFVKSDLLDLVEVPIYATIEPSSITLDHAVEHDLKSGQMISITGEIVDSEGKSKKITESEIVTISGIELDGIYTKLNFKDSLKNRYKRDTVAINANVASATHGETKDEVLGGGDPSQRQQQFTLKQTPLTYIPASTASGAQSTLQVRVDGILWNEVSSLYNLGHNDHAYMVRINDGGETRLIFGDGIRGMRPTAGSENIKAKYRVGSGTKGMLDEGKLSLLMSRPLGVRSVTNPVQTSGADDQEVTDDARDNAPLTVLTMDRIISLKDAENFALAFAGVGKAQAIWIWDGEKKIVRLTIGSATGDIVDKECGLYQKLTDAINVYKDPLIQIRIESFTKRLFNVEANIAVAKDRRPEDIYSAIGESLQKKFSFDSRRFNQPVTLSEIMAAIQVIDGVVAVDLNYLYIYSEGAKFNDIIPEKIEIIDKNGNILPAWLLIVNPEGIILKEMKL
jgi:hypothetical protein